MLTTTSSGASDAVINNTVSLHQLAARLVQLHLPLAVSNRSFIINDINRWTQLKVDPGLVAAVLGQLIHAIALHAPYSCIRISDSADGVVLSVRITHTSLANPYSIAQSLQSAQERALQLQGYVGISNQGLQLTTVIFSFTNI